MCDLNCEQYCPGDGLIDGFCNFSIYFVKSLTCLLRTFTSVGSPDIHLLETVYLDYQGDLQGFFSFLLLLDQGVSVASNLCFPCSTLSINLLSG